MHRECKIGKGVDFGDAMVTLGDCVEIGDGVKVIGPGELIIGDYSKIHRNSFINASGEVILGEQVWIGERSTLDGTGSLLIGNFVGLGIGSSASSHVKHGDVTFGCKYQDVGECILEDDAWFIGECHISPIRAGRRSVALPGSVVAKDMKPNRIYGGVPATDVTAKLGAPWIDRPLAEIEQRVNSIIDEASVNFGLHRNAFQVVRAWPDEPQADITYYNIVDREYTKRFTAQEITLNKFMFSGKAKFRAV